jgi:hypothetical protein
MKKSFLTFVLVAGVSLIGCKLATAKDGITNNANTSKGSSLKVLPYSNSQVKGEVKVTIVSISRITKFAIAKLDPPGSMLALPYVRIRYLTEYLDNAPITDIGTELKCLIDGTDVVSPTTNLVDLETHVNFSEYTKLKQIVDLPTVTNKKRCHITTYEFYGSFTNGQQVDLEIIEGYNGKEEKFAFQAIPLF